MGKHTQLYELASQGIVSEKMKTGLFIAGTLGKLYDHLFLTSDYEQARTAVTNYVNIKTFMIPIYSEEVGS